MRATEKVALNGGLKGMPTRSNSLFHTENEFGPNITAKKLETWMHN